MEDEEDDASFCCRALIRPLRSARFCAALPGIFSSRPTQKSWCNMLQTCDNAKRIVAVFQTDHGSRSFSKTIFVSQTPSFPWCSAMECWGRGRVMRHLFQNVVKSWTHNVDCFVVLRFVIVVIFTELIPTLCQDRCVGCGLHVWRFRTTHLDASF